MGEEAIDEGSKGRWLNKKEKKEDFFSCFWGGGGGGGGRRRMCLCVCFRARIVSISDSKST